MSNKSRVNVVIPMKVFKTMIKMVKTFCTKSTEVSWNVDTPSKHAIWCLYRNGQFCMVKGFDCGGVLVKVSLVDEDAAWEGAGYDVKGLAALTADPEPFVKMSGSGETVEMNGLLPSGDGEQRPIVASVAACCGYGEYTWRDTPDILERAVFQDGEPLAVDPCDFFYLANFSDASDTRHFMRTVVFDRERRLLWATQGHMGAVMKVEAGGFPEITGGVSAYLVEMMGKLGSLRVRNDILSICGRAVTYAGSVDVKGYDVEFRAYGHIEEMEVPNVGRILPSEPPTVSFEVTTEQIDALRANYKAVRARGADQKWGVGILDLWAENRSEISLVVGNSLKWCPPVLANVTEWHDGSRDMAVMAERPRGTLYMAQYVLTCLQFFNYVDGPPVVVDIFLSPRGVEGRVLLSANEIGRLRIVRDNVTTVLMPIRYEPQKKVFDNSENT